MRFILIITFFTFYLSAQDHSNSHVIPTAKSSSTSEKSESNLSHDEKKKKRAEKKALKKKEKEAQNFQFSILAGPAYNPDVGFILGGSFLMTFKTDTTSKNLPRSVVPVSFSLYSSGGIKFFTKSELYFNNDDFRVFSEISVATTAMHYYGVGYTKGKSAIKSDSTSFYREKLIKLTPSFAFRLKKSNMFVGPLLDITGRDIVDPSMGVQQDSHYIAQGGDSDGVAIWDIGFGAQVQYDSRDIASNAYKGLLLELKLYGYLTALGSSNDYAIIDIDYRQYYELPIASKRKVFAWQVNARQTLGDVPFTELSTIGSMYDLRGYNMGQFRDAGASFAQAEYRHMFNAGVDTKAQRFWSKWGFVAWGGIGAIGPSIVKFDGVLPNYGVGIRVELQPRMNLRLDLGRDPIADNVLFYMSVTEAF